MTDAAHDGLPSDEWLRDWVASDWQLSRAEKKLIADALIATRAALSGEHGASAPLGVNEGLSGAAKVTDFSERQPSAEKASLLTVVEVRKRVKQIAKIASDSEEAHSAEDSLHFDVLSAIAESRCADPAACAREAIKTNDIGFARWYA